MSSNDLPRATGGIVVEGVARSFGTVHAVRDASLVALPGRVTGLIGPNGSGKTTLFLMLASLLVPDRGRISLGGIDPVADPAGARERLGWMPDALGAWPSLTARETLRMTARLQGLSANAASARADELLALVELEELGDSPARVLSRGQKQRLGLARALVHDPSVLLLDEPASGLDPLSRVRLRELLRSLADEGKTVLISSHVLTELEELVDDVVVLQSARTVDAARVQQAAHAGREWRIGVVDAGADAEGLRSRIASLLGVDAAALRIDRGDVLASFTSERTAAEALRTIVEAGLAVARFAPAIGTLERTLLDLDGDPASPTSKVRS